MCTTSGSELLVVIVRGSGRPLRVQVEQQIRDAIRHGTLLPASALPPTRQLAADLGIARGIVVDAYAQLAAEGYLSARAGSATRVAAQAVALLSSTDAPPADRPARLSFRPGVPDLSLFPRGAWLAAVRTALRQAADSALGYGDPRGPEAARGALALYLGRTRGVVAHAERMVLCAGFTQGLALVARALRAQGIEAIGVEDPTHPEQAALLHEAGLQVISVAVDGEGIRVQDLAGTAARAVLITPAHQFPLGMVLSAERRAMLVAWARARRGYVIEDDYDAEYRYDRAPVGAVQGLDPESVIYAGSASKMLAPALRLGWLMLPATLIDAVTALKYRSDLGSPTIDGLAFAAFLEHGDLDRHLRRVRQRYRARRDAMVAALQRHLPGSTVRGIAAGLHLIAALPASYDEPALVDAAARRGIDVYGLRGYQANRCAAAAPALVLGYAARSESEIEAGISGLAACLHEQRMS